MAQAAYDVAHLDEIEPLVEGKDEESEWKPVRARFGITSFGSNAFIAREAGQELVEDHSEAVESKTQHEELYVVLAGAATFRVGADDVDAPAGTLLYVRDPEVRRSAVAREAGTSVIVFGGEPGRPFEISAWERKYTD